MMTRYDRFIQANIKAASIRGSAWAFFYRVVGARAIRHWT